MSDLEDKEEEELNIKVNMEPTEDNNEKGIGHYENFSKNNMNKNDLVDSKKQYRKKIVKGHSRKPSTTK